MAVIDTPSTPGNTVSADHWQGGREIAKHLRDLGHRKILLIGASSTSNVQNDRVGGFKSALDATIKTEVLWIENLEERNGPGCLLGLADKVQQGFTAFAAVSDLHALRALTELQRAGIRRAGQCHRHRFRRSHLVDGRHSALTTMRMDMATIADIAVAALVDAIENGGPIEKGAGRSVCGRVAAR